MIEGNDDKLLKEEDVEDVWSLLLASRLRELDNRAFTDEERLEDVDRLKCFISYNSNQRIKKQNL